MTELPKGWATTSVNDLFSVMYGKALDKAKRKPEGTFRYVGSGGAIAHTAERLTGAETIVVGRKGIAGSVQRYSNGCWPSDTTFYIEVPEGLNGALVEHQLRSAQLGQHDRSTALPGLGRPDLEATSLAIPPMAEQERIVAAIDEAFSKLDAGEAGLRIVRQLLKRMRDAILAAAVTGRLVPQDPTDTPATKLLADVGAAAGVSESALPPGWAACPLGAVTVCQEYGLSLKAHAERAEGDVPILRMGNVRAGRVDSHDLKFVGRGDEGVESRMLRDGDLLFNRTNSKELVGKSAVYRGSPEDATFASYLIRVRTADGVEPEWCASVIKSHLGRAYVEEVAVQQVGQANVNGTKLKQFPLLLPPREEQVRILAELARQASFLDACEGAVEGGLARSAALRRSVLKAAFVGKLVLQDPSDEPASVLLERIRAERAAAPKAARRTRRTA